MKKSAVVEVKVQEELPLLALDHVEFYVGNSLQAAHFYISEMGFQPLAYRGLETGNRDSTSYVLQQGDIRLVLTCSLKREGEINDHVSTHGDGVKVIAFEVEDATATYETTMKRGARSAYPPREITDEQGKATLSAIELYGDTIHVFVERHGYKGPFLPGFEEWNPDFKAPHVGLKQIDHCVGNVGWNQMMTWVKFYEKVLGFKNMISFTDDDISTEYTALMSKVMANSNESLKFPINEPAKGKKKSQIEEYLDYYNGPGVQHLAFATDDILTTVKTMKKRGVRFLSIPHTYYSELPDRIGEIKENIKDLEKLGILADRDPYGYLLQIFTAPVTDRPTLFFEVIQREGAKSFGLGNFKALFESIEREQARRGNLEPQSKTPY